MYGVYVCMCPRECMCVYGVYACMVCACTYEHICVCIYVHDGIYYVHVSICVQICVVFNSLYAFAWDVLMDWRLCGCANVRA